MKTLCNHFQGIKNLARTNNMDVRTTDMIVGVLYGTSSELSSHYKKINMDFPVFVDKEFWHRLTVHENFYLELSNAIGEVALEVDGRKHLQNAIDSLALEIEAFLGEE